MNSKIDKTQYLSFLDQIENTATQTLNLNDRVLIIDGLNTFIRAHAVNPALNDDGMHVGGLTGFLKSLRFTLEKLQPSRCIIVFDGKGGSKRRRKIFPEYKANRRVRSKLNRHVDWSTAPVDEQQSMKMQMSRLIEYLEQLPLTLISIDDIEADDAIGYLSKQILVDSKIFIMSTDRDFLQLVNDRIKVWSPTKKKLYDMQSIQDEYTIHANNYLLYRVLDGDKSDNIDGIKGAGIKSIIKYIEPLTRGDKFDLDDLIDYCKSSNKKIKLLESINNNHKLIYRNYLLMQLSDVDIPNHIKLKIQGALNVPIPRLIKYKFQTMFLRDKLSSQIKNFDNWITEFMRIDKIKEASSSNE
jgi:DNA polymerase-1